MYVCMYACVCMCVFVCERTPLFSIVSSTDRLYIGAPKENSTGAVHICDVREDRCQPHYRRISNGRFY